MIGALNTATLASVGGLEAETEDWHQRLISNKLPAGASRNTLESLNKFIITIKTNSFMHKIKRCNLFCGSNLLSALHPIIIGDSNQKIIGGPTDENHGFFEANYAEQFGLSAAGTLIGGKATKWLEPNVFVTSMGMDNSNGHLSLMSNNLQADEYSMPICGGDYSSPSNMSAFIEFGKDGYLKACSPGSPALGSTLGQVVLDNPSKSDISGNVWTANRTSNTNQKLYKGATEYDNSEATQDQSNYAIGGYKFRIFGAYSGGQITQTSNGSILFYSLGETLTEAEISTLSNAVKLFNTNIGRS